MRLLTLALCLCAAPALLAAPQRSARKARVQKGPAPGPVLSHPARTPDRWHTYWIGNYVDPFDDRVLHYAGAVAVLEEPSHWDLRPAVRQDVRLGSGMIVQSDPERDPGVAYQAEQAAIQALSSHASQVEAQKEITELRSELKSKEAQLEEARAARAEVARLRAELESLRRERENNVKVKAQPIRLLHYGDKDVQNIASDRR